jgi:hypothetical protein
MDAMKLLLAGLILGLGITITAEHHGGKRHGNTPGSLKDQQGSIGYDIEGLEGGYKPKKERFRMTPEDDE